MIIGCAGMDAVRGRPNATAPSTIRTQRIGAKEHFHRGFGRGRDFTLEAVLAFDATEQPHRVQVALQQGEELAGRAADIGDVEIATVRRRFQEVFHLDAHACRTFFPHQLSEPRVALPAVAEDRAPGADRWMARLRRRSVVGSPATVRAGLEQHAASYQVDEIMAVTICYDFAKRRRSYELLAREFGLTAS